MLPGDGGVYGEGEAVVDTQALAAAVAYVQEALIYRMRECEPVIGDGDPPSAEQMSWIRSLRVSLPPACATVLMVRKSLSSLAERC